MRVPRINVLHEQLAVHSPQTSQNLQSHKLLNGKVHRITGHEGPEGE